jgi:hypothetical protein
LRYSISAKVRQAFAPFDLRKASQAFAPFDLRKGPTHVLVAALLERRVWGSVTPPSSERQLQSWLFSAERKLQACSSPALSI